MSATNANKEKTTARARLNWHEAQTKLKVSKGNKTQRPQRHEWNSPE